MLTPVQDCDIITGWGEGYVPARARLTFSLLDFALRRCRTLM